eukprot:GEMP01037172.1.p1 GENE.GEMP01037172.1~~GEMP01037172.1.p1  ORF type:complete len:246 (+),score=37.18 GEMP01037172.1:105-740(+)
MGTVDLSGPVFVSTSDDKMEIPRYDSRFEDAGARNGSMPPAVPAALERAKDVISTNVHRMNTFMDENPRVVQLSTGVGGCALMILVLVSLAQGLNSWSAMSYLVNIYLLAFALTTVIVEFEHPTFESVRNILLREAHFLATDKGLGMFYIFQGSLAVMQEPTTPEGPCHFCFLNIMFILVGGLYILLGMYYFARSFNKHSPQANGFTQDLQ